MIDPSATPKLRSGWPLNAPYAATNISGRLTATDTKISPTDTPETPNFLAIGINESVNQSEPLPMAMVLIMRKIVISNYDSTYNPHYGGGGAVAVYEISKRLGKDYDVVLYSGAFLGSGQIIDKNPINNVDLNGFDLITNLSR